MPLNEVTLINPITVKGGRLKWVSGTVITMNAITTRDSTNTNNLVTNVTSTLNTAISGFGGLDTGSMQNNKLYYVYVIGDSSKFNPTGVILSLVNTAISPDDQAPTRPEGYDIYFRVGTVLTGGSADILAFVQRGNPASPNMWYTAPIRILTDGSATTTTAISLVGVVPPRATEINVRGTIVPNSAANALSIGTPPLPFVNGTVSAVLAYATGIVPTSEPFPVYVNYLVSNASDVANIYVRSYQDLLVA